LQKIAKENITNYFVFVAIEKKEGYATIAHYGFQLKSLKLVVKWG
jgi:hypothetical protein